MVLSQEKRDEIRRARNRFEDALEQWQRDKEDEEIFDLSMKMGLEEETVRKVWDAS